MALEGANHQEMNPKIWSASHNLQALAQSVCQTLVIHHWNSYHAYISFMLNVFLNGSTTTNIAPCVGTSFQKSSFKFTRTETRPFDLILNPS